MKLLKHLLLIAFLLPMGLMAQETQKTVTISVDQTVDGEQNQFQFKYLIDDETQDVEEIIQEVKDQLGIDDATEDVNIEMEVAIEEAIIEEAPDADKPFLGVALGITKQVEMEDDEVIETVELFIEEALIGGAAEAAGVQASDKLVAIDGQEVGSMSDLSSAMSGFAIGDEVTMTVERAGETLDLILNLTAKPESVGMMHQKHKMMSQKHEIMMKCDAATMANCCPGGVMPTGCCDGKAPNKALLGVTIEDAQEGGVKVIGLTDDGGADLAGMRVNDVITKVDKKDVNNVEDLIEVMAPYKPEEKVKVAFVRDGKTKKSKVELQARAEAPDVQWTGEEEEVEFTRYESKENIEVIRLNDAELDELMEGEEVRIRVTQEDEKGEMFTKEVFIQLEEGADPCPEFNVIITRLDEVEKETIATNDASVNLNKMGDLKVINLSLFPNPNSGKFELDFSLDSNEPVTVRLISLQGKEIYRENIGDFKGKYNNFIDISQNTAGVYVLQVMQNEQVLTRKIVIDK